MRSKTAILAVSALLLLTIVAIAFASASSDKLTKQIAQSKNASQNKLELPKLFDFEYYKTVFKKKYNSLREELVRRKIVLAKAFRAFVSGISYKYKRSKFYLALNPRSDRTPEEIAKSFPKIDPVTRSSPDATKRYNLKEPVLVGESQIKAKLESIEEKAAETGDVAYKAIAEELENMGDKRRRRKRESQAGPLTIREDFSLDNLIKTKGSTSEPKYGKLPSNNPNYEKPKTSSKYSKPQGDAPMPDSTINRLLSKKDAEPDAKGLIGWFKKNFGPGRSKYHHHRYPADQEESSSDQETEDDPMDVDETDEGSTVVETVDDPMEQDSGDIRLVDHSKSNCMIEVGNQGQCGSCYVFAATAYYSWLLCQMTGQLVVLSEQYVVDCGPVSEYGQYISGCNGGYYEDVAMFFEKYGMELLINYPYVAREGTCPYENLDSNHEMGYIRLSEGSGRMRSLPLLEFNHQLEKSPILASICAGGSFQDYGGGVHDGVGCCTEGDCGSHAMLLVGHGREDGEEYWLFRNSYSAQFGEDGHYRLSKDTDCFKVSKGFVFATDDDGSLIDVNVDLNHLRPDHVQHRIMNQTRYWAGEPNNVNGPVSVYR